MPQINSVTLTGNAQDSVFGYIGRKGDIVSFRSASATGKLTESSVLTTSNVENPSLQRTRISFKLKEPVTSTINGEEQVVGENEVDISFRLSHYSTEADRLAIRERVVDLLGESNVAVQIEHLESWF
jgi:ribosomal protein S24E